MGEPTVEIRHLDLGVLMDESAQLREIARLVEAHSELDELDRVGGSVTHGASL